MGLVHKLLIVVSLLCVVGGFVAALAAHLLLQFYIDHERMKNETGAPGWRIFGSIQAPIAMVAELSSGRPIPYVSRRYGDTSGNSVPAIFLLPSGCEFFRITSTRGGISH